MTRRLALLLVALGLTVAARLYVELRIVPLIEPRTPPPMPSLKGRAGADRAKLAELQARFARERDQYLKLRNAGAPADQLRAQYQRVIEAVAAVHAIGGPEAIRAVPRSKYAPISRPDKRDEVDLAAGRK